MVYVVIVFTVNLTNLRMMQGKHCVFEDIPERFNWGEKAYPEGGNIPWAGAWGWIKRGKRKTSRIPVFLPTNDRKVAKSWHWAWHTVRSQWLLLAHGWHGQGSRAEATLLSAWEMLENVIAKIQCTPDIRVTNIPLRPSRCLYIFRILIHSVF